MKSGSAASLSVPQPEDSQRSTVHVECALRLRFLLRFPRAEVFPVAREKWLTAWESTEKAQEG